MTFLRLTRSNGDTIHLNRHAIVSLEDIEGGGTRIYTTLGACYVVQEKCDALIVAGAFKMVGVEPPSNAAARGSQRT